MRADFAPAGQAMPPGPHIRPGRLPRIGALLAALGAAALLTLALLKPAPLVARPSPPPALNAAETVAALSAGDRAALTSDLRSIAALLANPDAHATRVARARLEAVAAAEDRREQEAPPALVVAALVQRLEAVSGAMLARPLTGGTDAMMVAAVLLGLGAAALALIGGAAPTRPDGSGEAVVASLRAEAEAAAAALHALGAAGQALDERAKQAQARLAAAGDLALPMQRVAAELAAVRPEALVEAGAALTRAADTLARQLAAGEDQAWRLGQGVSGLEEAAARLDAAAAGAAAATMALRGEAEAGLRQLVAAAPSGAPLQAAARELADAAAVLARDAAAPRHDPLPVLQEAAEVLKREADNVADRNSLLLPTAVQLEALTRELAQAAAVIARDAATPPHDPLPTVLRAVEALRDEATEAVRRIESAAMDGAEILAEAPATLRAVAEATGTALAGSMEDAAGRLIALAETGFAAAQRSAMADAARATEMLAGVRDQVAQEAAQAGMELARGAAVLEAAAGDLGRVASEIEAGSGSLLKLVATNAAPPARDASPDTAAHSALSMIAELPPALRATLARLGEVDDDVRALLLDAEALAMEATAGAAPMPAAVQAHTPALLDSLDATIGRLRSVATALALAGDAAASGGD